MSMKRRIKSLDDQIREIIKDRKLTGYRLGQMSGVSDTIINRFIKKERTLTLTTASKLTAALGMELKPARKGKG